jgi:outer membrane receptor protein involved in Fe transport
VLVVGEATGADADVSDRDLELANLVQSAAKGVTTVQEAPAIITILTAEELAEKSLRSLEDSLDTIPGWMRTGAVHNLFPYALTRGVIQGMLVLHNGVSLFDPVYNVPSLGKTVPLETFKRVEVTTGPGGVLWGANSFLGVVNAITKDAEDVDGVEASLGFGDGPGERRVARGSAKLGLPRLLGTRAKLVAHVSFESTQGPLWEMPTLLIATPLPQPNSASVYGPIEQSDQPRSTILNFDGKLTLGPWNAYWSLPWARRYYGITFQGSITHETYAEDDHCPSTTRDDPRNVDTGDACLDPAHLWRKNGIFFYERYGVAEYRARSAQNTAGITARGYFVQFVREVDPFLVFPPTKNFLEGGMGFSLDPTNYRSGAAIDGDVVLGERARILYGAEGFHEWVPDTTSKSRQGGGIEMRFWGPYTLSSLPLPCPRDKDGQYIPECPLTNIFAADRTVFGAYVAVNVRPRKDLILDAGARVQGAPQSMGKRSYAPLPIVSLAAVYEFAKDWHLKLNYTEGFRPPVFNTTDSNGLAVGIKGEPNLSVERSRSLQTEINARVLRGRRELRELDLRADYSYTTLDGFIGFGSGFYHNTKPRGIHSGELLAKLYLKGDHRMELGYTYLRTAMADVGISRAIPEHWFHLSGFVTLLPRRLRTHVSVKVLGAFEDPNRRVEARDLAPDPVTRDLTLGNGDQTVVVATTDLAMDRIAPTAELEVGLRYALVEQRLTLAATVQNALNARHYQPDAFHSYQPRTEFLPNPYEDIRFFVSATWH